MEKITLTFDLEDPQDAKIYQELEETFQFLSSIPFGPSISKHDILKIFFKKPLESELINFKKERITYEQKVNLWVKGYCNLNNKEVDKYAFIVDILPSLSKKQLLEIEKVAMNV